MKRLVKILLMPFAAAVVLSSCGDEGQGVKSIGGAMEILVIAERPVWGGEVGDTLRSVLGDTLRIYNQPEPMFDLTFLPTQSYKGTNKRFRNLVVVNIGSEFPEPSINAGYNVFANPQLLVEVTGSSEALVSAYISSQRKELQQIFEMAEMNRFVEQAKRSPAAELNARVKEIFGFDITIPSNYSFRNSGGGDFLWASFERPLSSQGIIIYSYPYTGREDFEADSIIMKRNEFVAKVPGPSDGSYMSTSVAVVPEVSYMRINGRFWAKTTGFWDVEGDFMGGPFVSFSTLDTENNRVVCIDEYVFYPNEDKRTYMKQLESFVLSVQFPGDAEVRNSTTEATPDDIP